MDFKFLNLRMSKATRRKHKALLVWELGAGFTHVQNMLGVARYLRSLDIECIVASADPRFDPWFRCIGCKSLQSYIWPVMRHDMRLPPQRKARFLSDILVNFGLCEPAHFPAMLAHYSTLFDLVQPDILLCENAPAAALAARGRIRTILFGSTLMMLPPQLEDGLAPIDPTETQAAWREDKLLDALNAGLGSFALPALGSVRDLMDCNAVLPFGPAAFDPYSTFRDESVLSPYCPDLPAKDENGTGDKTVVYLHEGVQNWKPIMDAIMALPAGSKVYIPSLSEAWVKRLSRRGLQVEHHMMPLKEIAREACCLVHHGGVTLTAAALAMAVPQVVLARSKENDIAGRFLTEHKHGHLHAMTKVTCADLTSSISEVQNSVSMRDRARTKADAHRGWFKDDPTYHVACVVAEMLSRPMPKAISLSDHQSWSPL